MTYISKFESLTNIFLSQQRIIFNYCTKVFDIVYDIMFLQLYKPICKLLYNNPFFQTYIKTFAKVISTKKISKIISNATLKLLSKVMDFQYN